MSDILFRTDGYVFSYRVAGVCMQDGRILLQKPTNGSDYAFPGGHVAFGETHAETLVREFKEEIGADVQVGDLMWVGELFFPWGDRPCQQICLYYRVDILSPETPKTGSFAAREQLGGRSFQMEFQWVPADILDQIEVYPSNARALLKGEGVQHFIYREA